MAWHNERNPPITVGELIEQLSALDPSLGVLVEGYEGGLSSPVIEPADSFTHQPDTSGLFGDYDRDIVGTYRAVVLARDPWETY